MSDYGQEIINRLHENCGLHDINNPVNRLINNSVGNYLDNYDVTTFFDMFFLDTSEGAYLEKWGKCYNIKRKLEESDEDYRKRIILESLGHLTVEYLTELYDLHLYTSVRNFTPLTNTLVSDNIYIKSQGFMAVCDAETQKILNRKFVIGGEVKWLTL